MREVIYTQTARKQYLAVFYSTTHTMEIYADAKKRFPVAVMPIPRQISESCGLAIKYRGEDPTVFQSYFDTLKVPSRLFIIETAAAGERRATLVMEHAFEVE